MSLRATLPRFWGAALLLVAGCGGQKAEDGGTVAAVVNDKTISFEEVRKVTMQFQRQNMPADPKAQGGTPAEQLYYTALDRLIEQELILQHALKSGIQVTDEDVAKRVEELKGMAGGEERFQQILTENQATMDDVTRDMKNNLIVQQFVDQRRGELGAVSEEAVRSFYDSNPDQFGPKPQVHAQHILILVKPEMTETEKTEARTKAESLVKQARKGGDFTALAAANSQDPTAAQNKGDLGWFARGTMVPPFEEAAFALKPGAISDVVETEYGYHVIKVVDTGMTDPITFEAVAERIRAQLSEQSLQQRFRAVVDSLRAAADVEVKELTAEARTSLGS